MKKLLSIILSILVCVGGMLTFTACQKELLGQTLSGEDFLSAEPYIKWEGRYDYTESDQNAPSRINLYHTASGFTVDFYGSELKVDFYSVISGDSKNHYPYYNVALDDEVIPTVNPDRTFYLSGGSQTITIVSGLEIGYHTIKCLKMSEPYDALTSIVKVQTDGNFVKRDLEFDQGNFRFMFVCASGGSGHGSLGFSDDGKGSMGRNTENSSSLHSFNYLTARSIGADVQFVANSGWGVKYPNGKSILDVFDYAGITTSNDVNGAKTTAKWVHANWVPDVVIFNIGGNDTTASGFNESVYKQKCVELVGKIHGLYPNAKMIWTHTVSNAGKYAISALNDAGYLKDGFIKEVVIPKVNNENGTVGANGHNSFLTHIQSADILLDALNEYWGYTSLYPNVKLEDYQSQLKLF